MTDSFRQLPPDKIIPQDIQRTPNPAELAELEKSIQDVGVLQPLLVSESTSGFHLIDGHMRLTCAKALGLATVPVFIIPADHTQAIASGLHTNLYRQGLNPIDEMKAYLYLRDKLKMNNRDIAKLIGKGESYVSQRMGIEQWHGDILSALGNRQIGFSIARELATVEDDRQMVYFLSHAVAQGINYRTLRKWISDWRATKITPPAKQSPAEHTPGDTAREQNEVICHCCSRTILTTAAHQILLCDGCNEALVQAIKEDQSE